jgi:hypothetical protein
LKVFCPSNWNPLAKTNYKLKISKLSWTHRSKVSHSTRLVLATVASIRASKQLLQLFLNSIHWWNHSNEDQSFKRSSIQRFFKKQVSDGPCKTTGRAPTPSWWVIPEIVKSRPGRIDLHDQENSGPHGGTCRGAFFCSFSEIMKAGSRLVPKAE